MDIKKFIQTHLVKDGDKYYRGRVQEGYLRTHHLTEYNAILEATRFLEAGRSTKPLLVERLYCILNSITEIPKCPCGNQVKFQKQARRYGMFCSAKCTYAVEEMLNNNKAACKTKYGTQYPMQAQEVKDKTTKTFIKKYGVARPSQNPDIKIKIRKTVTERYGGPAPASHPEIKKKIRESWGKKPEEELEAIGKKRRQTFVNRYGVGKGTELSKRISRTWRSKSLKEHKTIVKKRRETCLEKYGVDNPLKTPEVQEKLRNKYWSKSDEERALEQVKMVETMRARYGVSNYNQRHLDPRTIKFRQNESKYKKWLHVMHHKRKLTLGQIAGYLRIDAAIVGSDFNRFGLKIVTYPKSTQEAEIASFLKSVNPELEILTNHIFLGKNNDICPGRKEVDIYIPSINLAIEFNGLFWHSYHTIPSVPERRKHYNKTKACRHLGIKLFQIFENEWSNSVTKDIWKSRLSRELLRNSSIVVYARDTEVVVLDSVVASKFLDENHLQGSNLSSSIYYGLVTKDSKELVAVMSFVHNKSAGVGIWELNRFCCRKYYSITGGASKLLKYFEVNNGWREIVSFADLRYSYGDVYLKLGFELNSEVGIRYYYTDKHQLFHRRRFQKRYLPKLLENYDPKLTETQNVLASGKYRIVYDCGKLKFKKTNNGI